MRVSVDSSGGRTRITVPAFVSNLFFVGVRSFMVEMETDSEGRGTCLKMYPVYCIKGKIVRECNSHDISHKVVVV